MADYAFSDAERWAVFSVQGDKCYMCARPLDLLTMEIDHVLPESLSDHANEFEGHLRTLKLPAGFQLNSFANWMPICAPCNKKKSDNVFEPSLLFQNVLEKAARNAPKAAEVAAELPRQRQIARSVNLILRGLVGGAEDEQILRPLLQRYAELNPDAWKALTATVHRRGTISPSNRRVVRLTPTVEATFEPGRIRLERVGTSRS